MPEVFQDWMPTLERTRAVGVEIVLLVTHLEEVIIGRGIGSIVREIRDLWDLSCTRMIHPTRERNQFPPSSTNHLHLSRQPVSIHLEAPAPIGRPHGSRKLSNLMSTYNVSGLSEIDYHPGGVCIMRSMGT